MDRMDNATHIIDLSKASLVELAYDYAAAEDSRNLDRLILYDAEIKRRGADVDFDNIYQRILGSLAMEAEK